MPPVRVHKSNKARLYEKEFVSEFRVNPNNDIYCLLCCQMVSCEKRFRVESHQNSVKHKKLLSAAADVKKKSQFQTFFPSLKKDFKQKLVEAFLCRHPAPQAAEPTHLPALHRPRSACALQEHLPCPGGHTCC